MAREVKTGGRKKGTPNAVNMRTREEISRQFDPLGFLGRVVLGEEIDGQRPTIDQRIAAATRLAGKVAPDLKAVDISLAHMSDDELLNIISSGLRGSSPSRS